MVEYEKWDKKKEAKAARRFWIIVILMLAGFMALLQYLW